MIITETNLQSFFYEKLTQINKLSNSKIREELIYYLSTILNEYTLSSNFFESVDGKNYEKVISLKFLEASNLSKEKQKISYKEIGDVTLFTCGFFSKSVEKKMINKDFYLGLGQSSYLMLQDLIPDYYGIPAMFKNLAGFSPQLVNLLSLMAQESQISQHFSMPIPNTIPNK
jgi:hypothetical protein